MIGNDIIDLSEAKRKSNWKRKGFLKKIFSENEKEFILNSDNPELNVWLLWSIKESAYKAHSKNHKVEYFSPLEYECIIDLKRKIPFNFLYEGELRVENIYYLSASFITKNFISTIVRNKDLEVRILRRELKFSTNCYKTQQIENYSALINIFSEVYNKPSTKLVIVKDESGIPYLYENSGKINSSISLSHHGKYGAFAFTFSNNLESRFNFG